VALVIGIVSGFTGWGWFPVGGTGTSPGSLAAIPFPRNAPLPAAVIRDPELRDPELRDLRSVSATVIRANQNQPHTPAPETLALYFSLLGCQPLDDAQGEECGQKERSAVTDERKRDSGNRHHAYIHADVDENVSQPGAEDTEDDYTGKGVRRPFREASEAPENESEQQYYDPRTDESELLADDRENEVRVLLRQEGQSFL
jgi:hypothetical protein